MGPECCFDHSHHELRATVLVCYGSLADITARSRYVRFTPDSGHFVGAAARWQELQSRIYDKWTIQ